MNNYIKLLLVFLVMVLISCNHNNATTDYAIEWSKDIKSRILADVNVEPDSVHTDTSENVVEIDMFSNKIKTKHYVIRHGDTIASFFFSHNQNFELVRELCYGISRNFEGIRYKGKHYGLAEFRYCDGSLEEQGLRFDGDVGIWKKWDSTGKLIEKWDNGNEEKLDGLKQIHYEQ